MTDVILTSSVKAGSFLKILEDYKEGKETLVFKYECVEIIDVFPRHQTFLVRNILGDVIELPFSHPAKKISGKGKFTAKAGKAETLSVTSAGAKQVVFSRCYQKMQVVVSNAVISNKPEYTAQLAVASNAIVMASNPELTPAQSTRLLALAEKLIAK